MIYNYQGNSITEAYSLDFRVYEVYTIDGIRQNIDRDFFDAAILSALSGNINVSGNKQGACTDGVYIYQTSGDATNYTYMNIIKYKIIDGTYTVKTFNGTPNFGHANDATYDPNTGYIYICTMLEDGSIIVLDADTLDYVKTVYAKNADNNPYYVWQICFDRINNCFYSSSGSGIASYDENWNYINTIQASPHPSATSQGCETDGTYIYRVTYNY